MNPSLEDLAAVQHEIWAHWMKYLFEVSDLNADGSVNIPADKVRRWKQQILTEYKDLSPKEKESDLEQGKKVMSLIMLEKKKTI